MERERERERKIVRGLKALYLVHLAAAAEWHSDGAPDEKLCCGGWELCTGRLLARLFCIPYSINCNTYEREKTFRELQVRTNTKCFQARVNDVSLKEGDGRLKIVQKRIAREGERKRGRARERAAASSILFNPISRRKRLSTYICLRPRPPPPDDDTTPFGAQKDASPPLLASLTALRSQNDGWNEK